MKIKKLGCLGIVAVMLLCLFGLVGCTDENEYARQRIKEFTEIEVPSDAKILYHCRDDTAFLNGRRAQYTVFDFESEPTNWLKENAFLEGRDSQFEMNFTSSFDFLPVKIEDISNEFIPNFENSYLYVEKQNVYFYYCPSNLMLIVHIAGH